MPDEEKPLVDLVEWLELDSSGEETGRKKYYPVSKAGWMPTMCPANRCARGAIKKLSPEMISAPCGWCERLIKKQERPA